MNAGRFKTYLILCLVVAFGGLATVIALGWTPRQGLDLAGGVSIILRAEGEGSTNPEVLDKTVSIIRNRIDEIGVAESEVSRAGESNILIQLPGLENEEQALELVGTTAQLTFRQVEDIIPANAPKKDRPEITQLKDSSVNDEEVVYPGAQEGDNNLYRLKPARLTGEIVTEAEAVVDPATGAQWSVSIEMNEEGAREWEQFTGELACLRDEGEQIKSQVAIVLDGQVESAAGMEDPAASGGGVECNQGIAGGQTQINMNDEQEARDLALVLKTGALPITLEQDQVQKVSPTLGEDSLNAGYLAGAIGIGLVMLYMLLYYRALAFVVWLGLAVFSAITYVTLAVLGETAGLSLSLAGIAGIIVSVGVTADSYIVAFERVKDEAHSGKTVRAAVTKGMERAFSTILVADTVTGAAAVILFFLAVGPVRGFALTLGIATVIDVLIAYFFTRSAVNLLARTKAFTDGKFFGLRKALGVTT